MESVRSHRMVQTLSGGEVYLEIIAWETGEVQLLEKDGTPREDIDLSTIDFLALWGRFNAETEFTIITETPPQAIADAEAAGM